jgi:hypothetical protein
MRIVAKSLCLSGLSALEAKLRTSAGNSFDSVQFEQYRSKNGYALLH